MSGPVGPARIIGVGNRLVAADAAGPAVCDLLRQRPLPAMVEVVDGGLAGLDLLRFFEDAERVVLVDVVRGFGPPGEVVVLDGPAVAAAVAGGPYDHAAGLAYLLRALPHLWRPASPPPVFLVGIEHPATPAALEHAAARALALAAPPVEVPA